MECKKTANSGECPCTYEPCARKGMCCDCIAYHLRNEELPACCFDALAEKTYDRSIENFVKLHS